MPAVTENPQSNSALPQTADESIRPLLARANLLRIRKQWDEAVAVCTEALRQSPRSASAHSLLGDIYDAQGNSDDALQWYAMALEIDPTNVSDRAKLERLTELQRIRLRSTELEAPPHKGRAGEKTLEWFDRIFPPGRSDSVVRLVLALSGGVAVVMAVCAGIIYFYITPQHEAAMAVTYPSAPVGPTDMLPEPGAPVVMTPSHSAPSAGAAESASSTASPALESPRAAKAADAPSAADLVVDTTALRHRIAPLLNSGEMQVAGLTSAPDGSLYLDLTVPNAGAEETVEHLRERALHAASSGAHALASLISSDIANVYVRIAEEAAPSEASHAGAKTLSMVFSAATPLRYFRDTDPSTMTSSDLVGRFQGAQWYTTIAVTPVSHPADTDTESGASTAPVPAGTGTASPSPPPIPAQ